MYRTMKNQRITTDDLEYLIFVLNGSPLVEASDEGWTDDSIKRDKILDKMEQIWLDRTWRKGLPKTVPYFIADQFPENVPDKYLREYMQPKK